MSVAMNAVLKKAGGVFSTKQLSEFGEFSAQLYCSGATEQVCRVKGVSVPAGQCHWKRAPDWLAATDQDMARSHAVRWQHDRWDPHSTGVPGFHKYGRDEAFACMRGRRVLVAGDSTSRDTFYEFLAVVGHPIQVQYPTDPRQYWPESAFEPQLLPAAGRDVFGVCMGNAEKERTCTRDVRWGRLNETSVVFQFLTRSNSSWELDLFAKQLGDDDPPDSVFVQCGRSVDRDI